MNYETMYHILVRACSDAIDLLDGHKDSLGARRMLQKALLEAEDMYISRGGEEKEEDESSP